jgi:hypothetical protein
MGSDIWVVPFENITKMFKVRIPRVLSKLIQDFDD